MYIYFEDWTPFKWMLRKKGVPEEFMGDKFIKAVACETRPQDLGYSGAVLKYDERPFEANFRYVASLQGKRLIYTGQEIEGKITALGLTDNEKKSCRALLRFGFDERFGYVERAITTVIDGKRLKEHPVDTVDLHVDRQTGIKLLHLDLFTSGTLDRLNRMINFRGGEDVLLSPREGELFRRGLPKAQLEGNRAIRK